MEWKIRNHTHLKEGVSKREPEAVERLHQDRSRGFATGLRLPVNGYFGQLRMLVGPQKGSTCNDFGRVRIAPISRTVMFARAVLLLQSSFHSPATRQSWHHQSAAVWSRAPSRQAVKMITEQHVREMALALPEAHEESHWGDPSFRVRNRIFAAIYPSRGVVVLKLPLDYQEALISAASRIYSRGRLGHQGWTHVSLERVPRMQFRAHLEAAWRQVAPKRAVRLLENR